MSIRRRLLLLLTATTVLFALLATTLAAWHSWRGFDQVEREAVERDGVRLSLALEREGHQLANSTADWAIWDDTYRYLRGDYPGYEDANLGASTLAALGISTLVIVDRDGELVWGGHYDAATEASSPPAEDLVSAAAPGGALHTTDVGAGRQGVVDVGSGLAIAAATPITDNDAVAEPVGMVLMAHDLDGDLVEQLGSRIQRDVELVAHEPGAEATTRSDGTIRQRVTISDVAGRPVADAIVSAPRDVTAVGRRSILTMAVTVLGTVLALGMAALFVFDRSVVRRVRVMRDDSVRIGATGRGRLRDLGHADELSELAASVNEMVGALERTRQDLELRNAELLELARIREDLVSVVSHELRTPLTSIQGMAATIHRHDHRLDSSRRVHLADRIERNARRLDRLVSDLLVLSRADQGSVTIEPETLAVAEVLTELADDLPVGFTAEVGADVTVHCDADHLRRMLTNLLVNADRYGEPPVTVSAARTGDRTRIVVRDAGPGVPPEFVGQLFERFTQASTGDGRTAHGIGLGLSIVRTLADANDGSVEYRSCDGGAEFAVDLPASPVCVPDRSAGTDQAGTETAPRTTPRPGR